MILVDTPGAVGAVESGSGHGADKSGEIDGDQSAEAQRELEESRQDAQDDAEPDQEYGPLTVAAIGGEDRRELGAEAGLFFGRDLLGRAVKRVGIFWVVVVQRTH